MKISGSLRAQLVGGFMVTALLGAGVGLYANTLLTDMRDEADALGTDGVDLLDEARSAQHALDDNVTQGITLFYSTQLATAGQELTTPLDETIETYLASTNAATSSIRHLLELEYDPASQAALDDVVETNSILTKGAAELFGVELDVIDPSVEAVDFAADPTLASGLIAQQAEQFATFVDQLVINARSHVATVADTHEAARRNLLIAGLLMLAVAAILATVVSNRLARRLKDTASALRRVAGGDLTVRVTDARRDEVAEMGAALNETLESTSAVIRAIDDSASRLAQSANVVQSGADSVAGVTRTATDDTAAVAEGMERAGTFITHVAAGTEQMTASIREIAERAQEASSTAASAVHEAHETKAIITKLGDSSAEIGEVLELIKTIAEQTNLLALNATIEAARAGEAGKGFAVVAGEVKELSQATEAATRQIAERIQTIQGDSREAIEAIGRIGTVIDEINGAQTTIAAAVEEQTAVTTEIGRSANELALMVNEFTQRITTVNAAMSEAGNYAVTNRGEIDELLTLSQDLKRLIARFTVAA